MPAVAGISESVGTSDPPDPYEIERIAYNYWGDPSSPYRDEERYIGFLNAFLAVDTLPDAVRLRAGERLRIASLNRQGTIAADFRFIDRKGATRSLHEMQGRRMLLIFYDPECSHCTAILHDIARSASINRAIADGSLVVLAVYAEGKRDVWDTTKASMPADWTVGYDLTGILEHGIYDLPAMPTPYLLDADRRVLLKDPTPQALIRAIDAGPTA